LHIDPLIISVLALAIALVALLLGPGIAPRAMRAIQQRRQARATRDREVLEYLRHAAIFFEGPPLFITETWGWGPGVPNYAASGSFPDQSSSVTEDMKAVKAAVGAVLKLYVAHSQKQGVAFQSKEEALGRLKEIRQQFWEGTELFAKSEWPRRWRSVMRELQSLRLPRRGTRANYQSEGLTSVIIPRFTSPSADAK
jgi:hypothetical protein